LILLILTLRVGFDAEYSSGGLWVWARIGPFRPLLYPGAGKKKGRAPRRAEPSGEEGKGGGLERVKKNLPIIGEVLGKLKKRLTIDRLEISCLIACGDPADTALAFGAASAGAGLLLPIFENNFRVRKRDIRTGVSFTEGRSRLYVRAQASVSVYHLQSVLLVLKSIKKT
jgi:hypothetical protein